MQWSETFGWGMVQCLNRQISDKVKSMIHGAQFISINCNEIIVVDITLWVSIHGHIVKDWDQYPLLLKLFKVLHPITKDIIQDIIKMFKTYRFTKRSNLH